MSLDGATMDERVPRDFETLRATILERRAEPAQAHRPDRRLCARQSRRYRLRHRRQHRRFRRCSASTLIRFAQHLGFDGFTSLQQVFRERLRERNSSYDERLQALRAKAEEGAGHRAIFDGFVAAASTSLNDISRTLDEPHLEDAIVAAGQGRDHLCARQAPLLSGRVLHRLCAGQAEDPQPADRIGRRPGRRNGRASPRRTDAVIAISFSPYAPATIEEARAISEQGVPIVAITDSSFSPLAQFAKVWFEVAEADFAGFRSLSATMALAMALTVAVGEKRRDRPQAQGLTATSHIQAISAKECSFHIDYGYGINISY